MKYYVTAETTGLVACLRGRYLLVYPRSRFAEGWESFGYFKTGRGWTLHLGLFGIQIGRSTKTRPGGDE